MTVISTPVSVEGDVDLGVVRLPPLVPFTVRVVDSAGVPIAGAYVSGATSMSFRAPEWVDGGVPLTSSMSTDWGMWNGGSRAGADGVVRMMAPRMSYGLPALTVSYTDPVTQWVVTKQIPQGASTTTPITVSMDLTSTVSGLLVDSAGVPLAGAEVRPVGGSSSPTWVTDSQGRFAVPAAGSTPLVFRYDEPSGKVGMTVISTPVSVEGDVDLGVVRLPPLVPFTVRVVDSAGVPIAGAYVSGATSMSFRAPEWVDGGVPLTSSMSTDWGMWNGGSRAGADGVVRMMAPRMSYGLPALTVSYTDPVTQWVVTKQIPQGASTTTPITVSMDLTSTVSGLLVDSAGVPLAGAEVRPVGGSSSPTWVTDSQGRFAVPAAGSTPLVFRYDEPFGKVGMTVISTPVSVEGDVDLGVVRLPPLVPFTVRVVDSAGVPIAGAYVSGATSMSFRAPEWVDGGVPLTSSMSTDWGMWNGGSRAGADGVVRMMAPRMSYGLPALTVSYTDPVTQWVVTKQIPQGASTTTPITVALPFSGTSPVSVPGAPTGVSAVAGDGQASVSWTAPASDGGSPVTGYTVTASPGGKSVTTTGVTSAVVTGLANGTSYTFTVTATNAVGVGAASAPSAAVTPKAPVTVPGVPTGVSAVAGDGQASVSWTAPASDGGSPVTGYTVTASPGGKSVTTTGVTSAVVTGLANGTSYTFTVTATNAVGVGAASAPSAAVTPKAPVTVPGVPTGVSAVAGDGQASVSWTAPASDGGSPVTGYTVTASPGGKSVTTTGVTSAVVTGLANGTSYTFTVTATNAVGVGAASAPSAAVTPKAPVTVPGVPTGVSAVAGDGQASVSWTAPASDGGSPVTGYTVTASPGGKSVTTTGVTSAVVTGLANGTSYTFTVTATNAAGAGAASAPSAAVTPKAPVTVPGVPTGVSAVAGDGQASVSWSAPASDGGSPVTGYTVTASPGGKSVTTSGATSAVVTGLANGTSYTFTVVATNPSGTGAASVASAAVTPIGTLSAPPTPTVSGTAKVGYAVTANPGTWGPAPVTLAYRWYRVSSTGAVSAITGATSSRYVATSADRGYRLKVTVTGSKAGYTTVSRTSVLTAVVATGTLTVAPTPKVSGTAKVGYAVTANPGTWGPAPVTLAYRWYRVSSTGAVSAITGATGSRYVATSADRGYRLKVTVTGSKAGYTTVSRTSVLTAVVATGTLTVAPTPKVSGTAKVGYAVTANPGTWGPAPVTLAYRWYRVSSTGAVSAITGATGSRYVATSADRGYRLKVTVTGSKTGYTTVSRTSVLTAAVAR